MRISGYLLMKRGLQSCLLLHMQKAVEITKVPGFRNKAQPIKSLNEKYFIWSPFYVRFSICMFACSLTQIKCYKEICCCITKTSDSIFMKKLILKIRKLNSLTIIDKLLTASELPYINFIFFYAFTLLRRRVNTNIYLVVK